MAKGDVGSSLLMHLYGAKCMYILCSGESSVRPMVFLLYPKFFKNPDPSTKQNLLSLEPSALLW